MDWEFQHHQSRDFLLHPCHCATTFIRRHDCEVQIIDNNVQKALQTTTTTDASQQHNTGPLGGPVIIRVACSSPSTCHGTGDVVLRTTCFSSRPIFAHKLTAQKVRCHFIAYSKRSTCLKCSFCLIINTSRPQKSAHLFIFFWITLSKVTNFNDIWCMKSWENLTSKSYKFAHLTWQL